MVKSVLWFFCAGSVWLLCATPINAAELIGGDAIGPDSSATDFNGGLAAIENGLDTYGQPAVEIAQNGSAYLDSMRVIVFGLPSASSLDLLFNSFDYKLKLWEKADYLGGLPPQLVADLGEPINVTLTNVGAHVVPDTVFGEASDDYPAVSYPSYDFRFDLTQATVIDTEVLALTEPLPAGDYILAFQSHHNTQDGGVYVSLSTAAAGLTPYYYQSVGGSVQHPRGVLGGQTEPYAFRWGWNVFQTPVLVGDYNGDGVVDAADYTVWRDAKENADLSLFNRDASKENGVDVVDDDDYMFWRDNFGMTVGSGAGAASSPSLPEPSAFSLLCLGALGVAALRMRHGIR